MIASIFLFYEADCKKLIEHSKDYVIENFLQSNKIEWKKTQ